MTPSCRIIIGTVFALFAAPAFAQAGPICDANQRLFDSPLLVDGATCIPEAPKRAAFLDDTVVYALELDIPTITRSYYSNIIVQDFPGLASRLDPATTLDVGNTWEMKGEALLNAQPDLVVTLKYWDVAIGFAKDIAPTLVIDDERAESWRDIPRMVADLFGKQAEEAALEAQLDARVETLKAALAASGKPTTISFTQIEAADSFWTFTTAAFGPKFLTTLGMAMGPSIPTPEEAAKLPGGSNVALPVSQENLSFIDADHVFFYANNASGDPAEMVANNPLFQKFAADRPGRVHFLKGEYWFRGSASSAHRIIDDIYRDVLAQDPNAVSPNPLAWTYQVAAQ
jgi:ABC-type Fe3+-hydroxamate transport system substrate-binding protein